MSDYPAKRKRKTNAFPSRFELLLGFLGIKPSLFKFTSDQPLNQCVMLLKTRAQERGALGYILNLPSVEIELHRIADATFYFQASKRQRRGIPIWVTGHMQGQPDTTTLITGKAESENMWWQVVVSLVGFALVVTFATLLGLISFPVNAVSIGVIVLIVGLGVALVGFERSNFVHLIQETVTNPEWLDSRKKKDSGF